MNPISVRKLAPIIGLLFFFSGFSALVYQVVWMRQLGLFLGSDAYSAAITLSVFLGGLSLGSWVAGKFADRLARPLLVFGVIEVAIGLYALFFGDLLSAFSPLLGGLYRDIFLSMPLVYQFVRVSLAATILCIPTILMGMTLPIIVGGVGQRESGVGKHSGTFYAINTLGAFCGTLGSAFYLIPLLGVAKATYTAVAINIVVGLLVVFVGLRSGVKTASGIAVIADPSFSKYRPVDARRALWGIGISGLAALALEVTWTRVLTLSFSGTVYSFAIMLSSFLFGIFLGSRTMARTIDSNQNPLRQLAALQIALGFSVALLGLLTYFIPKLFANLLWGLTAASGNSFVTGSLLAQTAIAMLLMIVPTTLLGATFPTAVRVFTPSNQSSGAGTSAVYAANTAGAVFGALLAGFVLIPALGSRLTLIVIAAIFLANGLTIFRWPNSFALISTVATIAICIVTWSMPQQTVANYGLQSNLNPKLIYHGEGVAHSVDVVRTPNGNIVMLVDGNPEADTSFIQRRHFILKAHLPLLLHPSPREVAVIGLGLGVTLAATERNPEVSKIQVIELTSEMPKAHQYLDEITDGVLRKPKVNLRVDDGRNFLDRTNQSYDMITADPIHPRITGVGYLYTEQYYRALKERLKPGGVVCQWMPMYNISRKSFDVAFRTFAQVFENASFWYVRGHGLFVATVEPFSIDYASLRERSSALAVAQDLASIEIINTPQLLSHMLMGPAQVRNYLASQPESQINTDDNAFLEHATPFEYLSPTKDIVASLLPYSKLDLTLIRNASSVDVAKIQKAWDERKSKIIPELTEPLR